MILSTAGESRVNGYLFVLKRTLDEAVLTGRVIPMARAIWQLAVTTVLGFVAALAIIFGYLAGATLLAIGALKPLFPNHVGFWSVNGPGSVPSSLGFKLAPDGPPAGGNWVILIRLVFGLLFLVITHRGAKAFLAWCRRRRSPVVLG